MKKFLITLFLVLGFSMTLFGVVDSQVERLVFDETPVEIFDGVLPYDSFLRVNNLVNAIEIERAGTPYSLYIYKQTEKDMFFLIMEKLGPNKYRVWNETVIEYVNNPYFSFSVKLTIKDFIQWTNPYRNLE